MSYAQKLVTVRLGGVLKLLDPVLELNLRIPEHPAGHSDNIRPPKPVYLATLV
jgi:hypothetical protein